jgi:hypothetical protein
MAAIARNYRRNPHTARFLMAFHTAGGVAVDVPEEDSMYEAPEHTGGSDGMVEINRGHVAEAEDTGHGFGETCDNPWCCSQAGKDARSEGQIRYMDNLIAWITEKDAVVGAAARTWTDNVTAAGKWSYDKADKFSISAWIDRLKAKNAELNEAVKAAPIEALPVVDGALPVKADKNGKPMALYYAVDIDGTTKFYRIKPGRKAGFYFINVQASDEFHSIRNAGTKAAIVKTILDAGAEDCMRRYGQLLGHCGRCGRTLTDETSRSIGIGPDCLGKM